MRYKQALSGEWSSEEHDFINLHSLNMQETSIIRRTHTTADAI